MLMSFASYNLWLPWQESGSVLASKFIDYEPGIHWNQCQMQSGTTSININRIYNPIKQGKDHDPKGTFIRNWVPEIKHFPENFIHEPWLMEKFNSSESLDNKYTKPIIDLSKTTKIARKKIKEITQKEDYWKISKEVYLKHGSRRKPSIKRKKIAKNIDLKHKKEYQFELKLEL